MTRRYTTVPDLAAGDVVYFDYLHLNEARKSKEQSQKIQHFYYLVEGKARPVLIVGNPRQENGVKWHGIFRITTKGLDEQGQVKAGHIPIDDLIDPQKVSYVCRDLEWYPENLASVEENGSKRIIKRLDQLTFRNLVRIIGIKALRG